MFTALAKCLHMTWDFLPYFHVPKLLQFMLYDFCTVQINKLINLYHTAISMPVICCGHSTIQFKYQMSDKVFLSNETVCLLKVKQTGQLKQFCTVLCAVKFYEVPWPVI